MTNDRQPDLTGNPYEPEQRGALIGLGGQYTVHDIGGGRVAKIPNAIDGSRKFVGGYGPHVLAMKRHIPCQETATYRGVCIPHVLRLVPRYPELDAALGHPRPSGDNCFTQDIARPVREQMPNVSSDEIRRYIDGYADICLLCWRYGIHDYIHFWIVNCGLDDRDEVVLLDFGEVSFDTPRMRRNDQPWKTNDVLLKGHLADEHHAYYHDAMKDRLSGARFEKNWAVSLSDLDRKVCDFGTQDSPVTELSELAEKLLERANSEEGWSIDGLSGDATNALRAKYGGGDGPLLQINLYRAAESKKRGMIELTDLPAHVRQAG